MSSDDTRPRLLAAAGEIFAEKGFKGATVREIIQRAGVNIAAVNYHFRDKEGLYIEAVKMACSGTAEQSPFPAWDPETPPTVKLAGFIRTILQRMVENAGPPWHRQLMLLELARPSPACEELVRDRIRPIAEVLEEILKELIPAVSRTERNLVAFSIIGQILHYRVNQPIIALLVGPEEFKTYDVNLLAGHITRFSLAALGLAAPVVDDSAVAAFSDPVEAINRHA
jgi:AcrR family transcriptional regulator